MNYTIKITEANKSQIQNIKRLNALLSMMREQIHGLEASPKTPTGRTAKAIKESINDLQLSMDKLSEERNEHLNALKMDIHESIFTLSKARAIELIKNDNKFLMAVSDSIESGNAISLGKSESREFFVMASVEYNGCFKVSVHDGEHRFFGNFELRSSRENYRLKSLCPTIDSFINSCNFKITDNEIQFNTSNTDEYSIYTYQVDDLKTGDVEAFIRILSDLNALQSHLNKNSDLLSLGMLTKVYSYVEKIFDLRIK